MPGSFDMSALTCSIALRDIRVLADIDVYSHEIGRPQPLIVHVVLAVMPPPRDSVEDAFDYVRIQTMAERLCRERIVLIETFARRIAETCLAHDLVLGATVTIEKPQAVPGAVASATIRMGIPA
jgi:dihydroneopterin aldolase